MSFSSEYTPTIVLEKIINTSIQSEVEVIDLAKSNLKFEELVEMVLWSERLEPDIVLIWAGNNWATTIFNSLQNNFEKYYSIINNGSFLKGRQIFEEEYRKLITSFIEKLIKLKSIPILIIPENNLFDWHVSEAEARYTFPNNNHENWTCLRKEIEDNLEKKHYHDIKVKIQKLIDYNEYNPVGYDLMAKYALNIGDIKLAKSYFEMARDTQIFRKPDLPYLPSFVKEIFIEEANKNDITVIDLSEAFDDYSKDGIGKNFFLDYCHHNAEGIRIAMSAAAKVIIGKINNSNLILDDLFNKSIVPNNIFHARSYFLAAIHNDHRGNQPFELLKFLCKKALYIDKNIASLMEQFVDIVLRNASGGLNKNFLKLCEAGIYKQYTGLFDMGSLKILDINLVNAIVESLKDVGIDIEAKVSSLRKHEYDVEVQETIDLLENKFCHDSYKFISFFSDVKKTLYYQAFFNESKFFVISNHNAEFKVTLTLRIKELNFEEDVLISVNDKIIMTIKVNDKWSTHQFEIKKDWFTNDDINIIKIKWPYFNEIKFKKENISNTPKQILRNLDPTYGEVFLFNLERTK